MTRLPLLLLLSLLLACPNRPTNDDDAANDDDASGNCEGEDLGPIDLTSEVETLDLFIASMSMVTVSALVSDTLPAFGDGTCPAWDGPLISDIDQGSAVLTGGGCVSDPGYRYDGSVALAWDRDGSDFTLTATGDAFAMTWEGGTATPAFSVLGIDGTFHWVEEGTINSTKTVQLEGWFLAHLIEGFADDALFNSRALFPEGFDGSWAQTRTAGPMGETQTLTVDVDIRCRAPLTQSWDLVFDGGSSCPGEPDSGTATMSTGGHTAIVDPDDDGDCDDCFVWTLDGTPQPPICGPS